MSIPLVKSPLMALLPSLLVIVDFNLSAATPTAFCAALLAIDFAPESAKFPKDDKIPAPATGAAAAGAAVAVFTGVLN